MARLRYIGLVLYDADRVLEAAATPGRAGPVEAQRSVFLDPNDPMVIRAAEQAGIPRDWIQAAQRSPVYALINAYQVALPLHPEYRTLPMVWYIPPLSPVVDVVKDTGYDAEDGGNLFAAIDVLRIPVEYLLELFTAGDVRPVDAVLRKLAAMRAYMRDINLGREPDERIPARVGMTGGRMYDMNRLLAIAKYDERYVIPPAHAEDAHHLEELATECSLDYEGGPGMGGSGPFGESSGGSTPKRGSLRTPLRPQPLRRATFEPFRSANVAAAGRRPPSDRRSSATRSCWRTRQRRRADGPHHGGIRPEG